MKTTKKVACLTLLLITICFYSLVGCSNSDSLQNSEKADLRYGNLELGDMLFENFKVIKINDITTQYLHSYEVVDLNSGVVYLYSYWSNGNGTTCTMTPLYNSDGTIRTHGGNQ